VGMLCVLVGWLVGDGVFVCIGDVVLQAWHLLSVCLLFRVQIGQVQVVVCCGLGVWQVMQFLSVEGLSLEQVGQIQIGVLLSWLMFVVCGCCCFGIVLFCWFPLGGVLFLLSVSLPLF